MIQFGENLLVEVAGESNGVSRAEVERSYSRDLKALVAVQKRSEPGVLGFPLLLFQTRVVKSIARYGCEVRGSYDTSASSALSSSPCRAESRLDGRIWRNYGAAVNRPSRAAQSHFSDRTAARGDSRQNWRAAISWRARGFIPW